MPTFRDAAAAFAELDAAMTAAREAMAGDPDCRIETRLISSIRDMGRLTSALMDAVQTAAPADDDNEHRLGVFETLGRR